MITLTVYRRDNQPGARQESFSVTEEMAETVAKQVQSKDPEFVEFTDANLVRYFIARDAIREVRIKPL